MPKINKHIEIVRSNGYGLSSLSQASCDAIFGVLSKHYATVGITTIDDVSDFEILAKKRPNLVFLGIKFVLKNPDLGLRDSEKIWISDYLDKLGINYTGSSHDAQELGVNKPLAKQRVLDSGLETSKFYVARQHQPSARTGTSLEFPLFVKPAGRGSGVGVDDDSVVHNQEQLKSKVYSIVANLQSDALIEEYLSGREFSVAILQAEHSPKLFAMPLELIAQPNERGERLLSSRIKSSNTERVAEITDMAIKSAVSELAISAFRALGAKDYGRIDIRMNEAGIPHFLEANLLPNLVESYGSFPKACVMNLGLNYESMILQIVRLGLKRSVSLGEIVEPIVAIPALTAFETVLESV